LQLIDSEIYSACIAHSHGS